MKTRVVWKVESGGEDCCQSLGANRKSSSRRQNGLICVGNRASDVLPDSEDCKDKTKLLESDMNTIKKRTIQDLGEGKLVESDAFCWICHSDGPGISCELCPRFYHIKCLIKAPPPGQWICPECQKIMSAEAVETKSKVLQVISIDTLSILLRYVLQRMKIPETKPFHHPVDCAVLPTYADFVFHPMDFATIDRNIKRQIYGSTEAFIADVKWILHNCIIFNGKNHPLTSVAKSMFKICCHETSELHVCPDCYLNSCIKENDDWFCEPCRKPHILVWAKMKGYPFWPAKVLREENNQVDVRFFGEHDRAWVSLSHVYLLSENPPGAVPKKTKGFDIAKDELKRHLELLKQKFGAFSYAPDKTLYKSSFEPKHELLRGETSSSSSEAFSKTANKLLLKRKLPLSQQNHFSSKAKVRRTSLRPNDVKENMRRSSGGQILKKTEDESERKSNRDSKKIVLKINKLHLINKSLNCDKNIKIDKSTGIEAVNKVEDVGIINWENEVHDFETETSSLDKAEKQKDNNYDNMKDICTSNAEIVHVITNEIKIPISDQEVNQCSGSLDINLGCTKSDHIFGINIHEESLVNLPQNSDLEEITEAPQRNVEGAEKCALASSNYESSSFHLSQTLCTSLITTSRTPQKAEEELKNTCKNDKQTISKHSETNEMVEQIDKKSHHLNVASDANISEPACVSVKDDLSVLQRKDSGGLLTSSPKELPCATPLNNHIDCDREDRSVTNAGPNMSNFVTASTSLAVMSSPNDFEDVNRVHDGKSSIDISKYTNKMITAVQNILSEFAKDLLNENQPNILQNYFDEELRKFRQSQKVELDAIKHSSAVQIAEMKLLYMYEKKKFENQKLKEISSLKSKLWCANCLKEAFYNCCWKANYCGAQCQEEHWQTHSDLCARSQESCDLMLADYQMAKTIDSFKKKPIIKMIQPIQAKEQPLPLQVQQKTFSQQHTQQFLIHGSSKGLLGSSACGFVTSIKPHVIAPTEKLQPN